MVTASVGTPGTPAHERREARVGCLFVAALGTRATVGRGCPKTVNLPGANIRWRRLLTLLANTTASYGCARCRPAQRSAPTATFLG